MRQKFALIVFVLFGSVFPVQAVFGYNDTTTHPALTNSTADFYNLYFTQKMSSQEKEWLISGSIQEDTPPRWINHFYDPVYNQGWTGEHSSDFVSQDLMRKFSDVFFSRESAVSAINWAHNQELQEKYKLYKGNQTWEKAIYEYVKNGNKEEAFRALGDILHLLQDMTVPEHTRNDTHPNDSPYENYANQFTRNSWNISSDLKNQNEQPAVFNSIDDYFNYLANYSNNYFFSKDTINDPKYNKPKITHEDGSFAYGLDKNGNKFELSKVKLEKLNNYEFQKIYDIKDDKFIILSAYWTRLSREAILAGAGVVDLFFKEVEKAKKDESLLKQPPESQSANAYFYSIYGEAIKLKNFVSDVRHSVSNTVAGWFSSGNAAVPKNGNEAAVASALSVSDSNVSNTASSDTANTANANEAALNNSGSPKISQPRALVASDITNVATNEVVEQLQKSIPPQTQPPLPTLAKSNSSEIGLPAGRQDFPKFPMGIPASAVGGGGSAAPIVSNTSVVSQNQSTVQSDSSSENSTTTTTTTETETATTTTQASSTPVVNTDTTPPSVSFSVAECDESLSLDGCLVSATALHLNWQSSDEDLDYFELTQDSAISTTTATSTLAAVSDNSTANFSLRAKDTAGNWSTPTAIILEISKTPVVINEVAWAGTGPSNSQDEWIELYNRTSKSVSLNKWLLYSQTDMGPYLRLSGAIPARSYYLIERTNDDTIKDILADFIAPFGNGLSNSGEVLVLSHASTTIDQTVLCGFGPTAWCPGFDYKYRTMERINADTVGTDTSNWGYNNTIIQNGKNGKDSAINGTPKSSNSVTHLIANGAPYISTDVTLTKNNSPYLVNNTIQVFNSGTTLTIEPGVVIKFYNDAGLNISGKMNARGTAEEPLVFTSFEDDEYGGDFNNNGATTVPTPGGWFGVKLSASASGDSVFEHSIFRYGGKYYSGGVYSKALLATEGPSVSVSDSVFEYSKVYGLSLAGSSSKVTNNIFRYNSTNAESVGLYIGGGEPVVENNQFLSNQRGLYLSNSSSTVSANIFSNNSGEAIYSNGVVGVFENNSGNANGLNGIFISGNLTQTNETRTLKQNALPYVLPNSASVVAVSTLNIEKNSVVKGQQNSGFNISGKLSIGGDLPGDIIFESAYDNASPGDWAGINVLAGGILEGKGFTIKHAGSRFSDSAAVWATNADVTLDNVLFDNNYKKSLMLVNSSSKLENVVFQNNMTPAGAEALSYHNSPIYLKNANFSNNWLAVYADSASILQTAENIIFENNNSTTSPANLF